MLMDRFPGVEVRRTANGGVSIRIRGPASFYGNTEPLLVVDGTPIVQGSSGFSWLNPHDIATITVLKNPTDTAIYGLRGANGVIVITTMRPGGS
jgi:TonB-dependent SusC/RagA subfamily outer membrane receptor